MYKYSFLYVAVSVIVMLFLIQFSALKEYTMAQEPLSNQSQIVVAQTPVEKANLERFDKLDFQAWNNRNWTLFRELHAPDVLVVDFNGHTTKGIEQHVQWAMAAISAAPESRVLTHPIKIAAGSRDWYLTRELNYGYTCALEGWQNSSRVLIHAES